MTRSPGLHCKARGAVYKEGNGMYDREQLEALLDEWCARLRITPAWDVKLQLMDDPAYRKTGDIKIDCDDRRAIVILNTSGAGSGDLQAVLVHELFHLKMYPLDQVTEGMITSCFEEDSPAQRFAYSQFFTALEQTVEELARCFLREYGAESGERFGRCERMKSFNDLYAGLRPLE